MIRFSLHCDKDHQFEAWFSSGKDFDSQSQRGLVECPVCGSRQVGKSLMAPAVSAAGDKQVQPLAMAPEQREMMRKLRHMVQAIKQNSEDVGPRFADEARKIHHGEAEARGIFGQATKEDARSLVEDGIDIAPLPELPDDLS
ncbi:DUF1178 family protein [Hoeflea sp. YIM 152468]|uniref:DUF1178 family protein n=1 Tax=Hoeflea sp. YIM 152468 TaxID=3031759 RepID=UPI0023D9E7C2|nr:DUF1178 family protein [Hoeflea sp. YIM 152468]MDF1608014.1 DUF1178 family protein [Hoeflea sp. YIM 152468]